MSDTSTSPLDLNSIEQTGATRFGRAIIRAVFSLEDGRSVTLDIPICTEPWFGNELRFTTYEAIIVDLFQRHDAEARLKGTQIASLLKEELDTLKKHLAGLVRMEVLDNDRSSREGYFRGKNFPQKAAV